MSSHRRLRQTRIERYGHVKFSVAELTSTFAQFVDWVVTRPEPAI